MVKWIFHLAFPALLVLVAYGWNHSFPKAQSGEGFFSLPKPNLRGLTVEEAIEARRSIRNYTAEPLSLEKLSQLLYAAQGITGHQGEFSLRSAPSAGALYPIELYVVVHNVAGLEPGLYHYQPYEHDLKQMIAQDLRSDLVKCCLGQECVGRADVVLIMTAVYARTTSRYGQRGIRYVHMEAGHISQNIYLQATSLGLGSVAVGAFHDEELNRLLGVVGEKESALYVHPVGTLGPE